MKSPKLKQSKQNTIKQKQKPRASDSAGKARGIPTGKASLLGFSLWFLNPADRPPFGPFLIPTIPVVAWGTVASRGKLGGSGFCVYSEGAWSLDPEPGVYSHPNRSAPAPHRDKPRRWTDSEDRWLSAGGLQMLQWERASMHPGGEKSKMSPVASAIISSRPTAFLPPRPWAILSNSVSFRPRVLPDVSLEDKSGYVHLVESLPLSVFGVTSLSSPHFLLSSSLVF